MTTEQVEELKSKGNIAFSSGKFTEAIESFSRAIELDAKNHVLYSNRSAAYASLKEYEAALNDAEVAVGLQPTWAKGHGRRGAALLGLKRLIEAKESYMKAIELDSTNIQLKKGLEMVEAEIQNGSTVRPPPKGTVNNPFSDPALWAKLQSDPTMAEYLRDPSFAAIMEEIRADPNNLMKHIKDRRVTQAFAIMLGVDIKTTDQMEEEGEMSSAAPNPTSTSSSTNTCGKQSCKTSECGNTKASPSSTSSTSTTTTSASATSNKNTTKSQPAANDNDNTCISTESYNEKEMGNQAYKKREFEQALYHYNKAIELDPTNLTLLTNKAAVLFETSLYDECISLCEEVVNRGRETCADFKLLAKALGRIGSAHEKKGDLETAIIYYQKSLTEHRTPDTLAKLKDAEKTLEQARQAAYHNPALAEVARSQGNECFKRGEYVEALQHYSEAIKRDEKDPRGYSNRAACYAKLAAVPEGLKDCDKALTLDPTFVKAHIRRATLLHLRRDYAEALTALDAAAHHDTERRHAAEIQTLVTKCYADLRRSAGGSGAGGESEEETLRRASQNPEIREILADPVMMQILRQMQADPAAAAEHLRNPEIATKIRKLVAAGIVKTG